ncbi:MAG: ribonuclease HII [Bacteroidota bacterium]|nr:ribonuclease HII [Bacteroidota bacterium]
MQTQHTKFVECGTDEAGRGCLAGPVTAAAVILPPTYKHPLLTDSKKLTAKQRKEMRKEIEHVAISFAIAHVMPERIDEINILNASIEAMHLAIEKLDTTPAFILVDGNRFKPYLEIPHKCMIKGDARFLNIAAASVLTKTERDEFMTQLHSSCPHYHWDTNKGYPTKKHRKGIQSNGASKWHRKSFTLLPTQTQFDF